MVANDVTVPGSGFESDNNEVTLIRGNGETESWPLQSKVRVAERLWDEIARMLEEN